MLTFEVNKQVKVAITREQLAKIATAFASERKLAGLWYFSLAFVGSKTMRRLNKLYRGKDAITDVLSFTESHDDFISGEKKRHILGEIIICVPQARKQAKAIPCSLNQEIARLLVHGLAHLSGYDHEDKSQKEARRMLQFEKRVLSKLKLWSIFQFEDQAK